jgi:hypothetical protein
MFWQISLRLCNPCVFGFPHDFDFHFDCTFHSPKKLISAKKSPIFASLSPFRLHFVEKDTVSKTLDWRVFPLTSPTPTPSGFFDVFASLSPF